MIVCASAVYAQAPSDVPTDHWAYNAVQSLASRGYVLGYPDGTFSGNRQMTRYEFATIVARILAELDVKLGETPAIQPTNVDPKAAEKAGVTKEDLETIQKLVDEFKVELTVIGTRLDTVEATVNELKEKLDTVDAIVSDPEGAFESAKSDISKLKKVTIGGYLQVRYDHFPHDINGSATPQHGNFSIRRSRIKVSARPTANSFAWVEVDDGGQNTQGTNNDSVSLKGAALEYYFSGDPNIGYNMSAGQMKWPFGYELVQSSGVRETPEQSLIVQRMFPSEYDKGFKAFGPLCGSVVWNLGVFNGTGANNPEADDHKDVVASARMSRGDLDFGFSGYFGHGITNGSGVLLSNGAGVSKVRYGADAELYLDKLTLKAEYITGKGVDQSVSTFNLDQTVDGYWAQLAYNFTKSDSFIAKYNTISQDPLYPQYGRRNQWDLGIIRWLDDKTRLKFFYEINNETQNSFDNNAYIAEWITNF